MKKYLVHCFIVLIAFPSTMFAIGLGEMKVHSHLNQPFRAEITLIDVGNTPLSGIKASIASVEDFKRIGLDRSYVLDYLILQVKRNKRGKPVIKLHSSERMPEPYLEILVDLAWAQGQVYRAYTVLLDPPAYQLITTRKTMAVKINAKGSMRTNTIREPGVIEKNTVTHVEHEPILSKKPYKAQSYGPTKASETIWEIAQRYKTPNVTLQQVVLAIFNANPNAFDAQNINGLKTGVLLTIPDINTLSNVSEKQAEQEIFAQNKAWNANKSSLKTDSFKAVDKHSSPGDASRVLPMPETSQEMKSEDSGYFSGFLPRVKSFLSVGEDSTSDAKKTTAGMNQSNKPLLGSNKTGMDIAAAAIESVREANDVLNEQLRILQADNKRLKQQLKNRNQELQSLRNQLQRLTTRQGVAGQVSSDKQTAHVNFIAPLIILIVLIMAGAWLVYWWLWMRKNEQVDSDKPYVSKTSNDYKAEERIPMTEIINEELTPSGDHDSSVRNQEVPISNIVDEKTSNDLTVNGRNEAVVPSEKIPDFDSESNQAFDEKDSENALPIDRDVDVMPKNHDQDESNTEQDADKQNESEEPSIIEFETEDKLSKMHEHEKEMAPKTSASQQTKEADNHAQEEIEDNAIEFTLSPAPSEAIKKDAVESNKRKDDTSNQQGNEFEPSVSKENPPPQDNTIEFTLSPESSESEQDIGYEPPMTATDNKPHEPSETMDETSVEEAAKDGSLDSDVVKPVKSKRALNTLIDLAKTYISMDDFESARQSLEEVLTFGTEEQKKEAKRMLEELDSN